jgi:hypothetical protein
VGEVARRSRLSGRLLFDEGLLGLGTALRWVYKGRVLLSDESVGRGAPDSDLIEFCRAQDVTWVTKDWAAAAVDEHVRRMRESGVSVWWLRQDVGRAQMRRREQLWIAARDIEGVLDTLDAGLGPVHLVSSVGRRARSIELPFIRARKPRRIATPTPMSQRSATGRLFDE